MKKNADSEWQIANSSFAYPYSLSATGYSLL